MTNIYSSHLLSNILLQFHSATDFQTEDILKAFNRLTNLNLTLEDVSNLNTVLTLLPFGCTPDSSERLFISEEIAKVCKEAAKHTPQNPKSLPKLRLTLMLHLVSLYHIKCLLWWLLIILTLGSSLKHWAFLNNSLENQLY